MFRNLDSRLRQVEYLSLLMPRHLLSAQSTTTPRANQGKMLDHLVGGCYLP
jgi:hypothetical protein